MAAAFAPGADRPAVRFDQPARDRQPEPQPANCFTDRTSPCSNAVKSLGSTAASMPAPVSITSTRIRPSAASLERTMIVPSGGVNLIALLIRFQKICCSRVPSP
jgi:hypothetical protein